MDSYPQYEEPVFAEHFNLVAFDARGHGMTTGDLNEGCTYSWKDVAIDIREALVSGILRLPILEADYLASFTDHESPLYRCWILYHSCRLSCFPLSQNCPYDFAYRSYSENRNPCFGSGI
jgi:hypothetical protein